MNDEENIPKTLDQLRAKINTCLEDPKISVSTIYTTYSQPYSQINGSFQDFLTNTDELLSLPPNVYKIRKIIFHIFLLLDIYHQDLISDPLPEKEFQNVLTLIRIISPLAMALQETTLQKFFSELEIVHGNTYPLTISKFRDLIGIAIKEPSFKAIDDENDQNQVTRKHYKDAIQEIPKAKEEKPKQKENYSVLPHQSSFINRSVHVRVKKPKHRPNEKH